MLGIDAELRSDVKRRLDEAESLVKRLRDAYRALGGDVPDSLGKYFRMPVWRAIFEYLRTAPQQRASVTDIRAELERAGVPLGAYPLRTIKNSVVSPYVGEIFRVYPEGNDEIVALADDAEELARRIRPRKRYKPSVN